MTARATVSVAFAMMTTGLVLVTSLIGCSSDDPEPVKAPVTDAGGVTLSAAYNAQCARCHGPTGLGAAPYPRLPGNRDVNAFVSLVRAGRNDMPAFDATKISDDDLRGDYEAMKAR